MSWKVVLAFLVIFGTATSSSLPCADVTHSECRDDPHPLIEIDVANRESCQIVCTGFGENCHFVVFDNNPFGGGNCRLYDADFSKYILNCNELAGPKTSDEGCNLLNPLNNSCQVYRSGHCEFGEVQETQFHNSWELCQAACKSTTECQFWRFEKEEKLCLILYSAERKCTWEFLPREPSLDECDDNPTTTTTITSTTINPFCDIPEPQKHGDWFCPSSTDPATCHLECHPGYVSTNATVISCQQHQWTEAPECITSVAIITGSYNTITSNTVEVYGEGIHKKLPNLPDNRKAHSLQLVNSVLSLCGGYYTKTSCLSLTASLQWTTQTTTTSSRSRHSSVSMMGQLHLLGGYFSPSTTEHLTPPSQDWINGFDLLEDTFYACAAKIEPEVFIVTGGAEYPSSVVAYNVTSGAATRLKDINTPRLNHGCALVMDVDTAFKGLIVAGGLYDGNYLRESEVYDVNTGEWSNTGLLTNARNGVRLVVLGTNILALGGYDGSYLSTVDKFNITSRSWTATEEMMEARGWQAVAGVPTSLLKIGQN